MLSIYSDKLAQNVNADEAAVLGMYFFFHAFSNRIVLITNKLTYDLMLVVVQVLLSVELPSVISSD